MGCWHAEQKAVVDGAVTVVDEAHAELTLEGEELIDVAEVAEVCP